MRWFFVSLAAAMVLPIATWYGLYRLAGYGPLTTGVAHVATLVLAIALVTFSPLRWTRLGLGVAHVGRALVIGALAYAVVVAAGAVWNAFGADVTLWRSSYGAWPFIDNWLLTALPEELLYAGVLFGLLRPNLAPGRRWLAIPIVAVLFGLGHLPGYLAMGYEGGGLMGRLGLNLASWLIFGTIYAMSGNLWLVVVAHAATDHGVTPLVTSEPTLGLIFMTVMIAGAWRVRPRRGEAPPEGRLQLAS